MYILCIASLTAIIKDNFEATACHLTQRCVAVLGSAGWSWCWVFPALENPHYLLYAGAHRS